MYRKSKRCRACWRTSPEPPRAPNPRRGPDAPQWKGDAARTETKRVRAQRAFALGVCEHDGCDAPATDRHHVDGDTGNNARENLELLCRRHHMERDGRLERFLATSRSRLGPQPPKPCSNCGRDAKPLRRGRCRNCAEYLRRRGVERPV